MKKYMNRTVQMISATAIVLAIVNDGALLTFACTGPTHSDYQINQQAVSTNVATSSELKLQEVKIPSVDKGFEVYLRHKSMAEKQSFSSKEVVLFLEPYSVPSAEAFDVPGFSWMEEYSKNGYDTWAMDFRGFGKSTRPAEMSKPAAANAPVVRAKDAAKDLEAAVTYIKKVRNVEKINIVGWSWGAVVAGTYATEHSNNIEKLVMYGAMHGFSLPSMAKTYEAPDKPGMINPKMPAYQLINFDKGMHHWHMMMNGRDLVSREAMDAVHTVFDSSDPFGATQPDKSIRRPNGPLVDLYDIWSNKPVFDASKITAPVLVIRGELDIFADPTFINKLSNAKVKREIVVPEATHWLLYEKHRDQLFNETDKFLKQTTDTNS